jgi:hypothetical protein
MAQINPAIPDDDSRDAYANCDCHGHTPISSLSIGTKTTAAQARFLTPL